MPKDVCLYPYHLEARKLPVHLTGIGGTAYQQPVNRPEGYFWHQMMYCAHGKGMLETGGARYEVAEGDLFFLPAKCPHAYWPVEESWDVRWIAFDGYALAQMLGQLEMAEPVFIRDGCMPSIRDAMEQMLIAQTNDRLCGDYLCSALVYSCIIEFHRAAAESVQRCSPVLKRALETIEGCYAQDISLARLASEAGVSPQHLCRIFRETMRMSPIDYLTQYRIREAQRMIRAGEMTLTEIAAATGFASAGYFSTVFRKWAGMSPSEYRRRINEGG